MIDEIQQTMIPGKVYTAQQLSHLTHKRLSEVETQLRSLCDCDKVRRLDLYLKDGSAGYMRPPGPGGGGDDQQAEVY